ncbi:hypothetical protein O0536_25255, partial [Brevibacillus laterosporus]|nr:hypothetical protein [Brevibacillus laterosporus]
DGDGEKFRINAIVVAGEEYMKVTAVAGDEVTVIRGFDGTTAGVLKAGAELPNRSASAITRCRRRPRRRPRSLRR